MNEATKDLVLSWLTKASHDLAVARLIPIGQAGLLDVAIYHCQQAAEKALKGYLVACDVRPAKTHDVGELVDQAALVDAAFQAVKDAGERLTPYATRFRYPGIEDQPEEEQFEEALRDAESIFQQVSCMLRANFSLET